MQGASPDHYAMDSVFQRAVMTGCNQPGMGYY
jgi:hypothetical protein